MKQLKNKLLIVTLFIMLTLPYGSEAANRRGSHRVGGTNSHGKGSHYVGGISSSSNKSGRRRR